MLPANPIPPSVRVHVATLAEADLGLRAWLDDRERARLAGYHADVDKARFLLGAAMLRWAVGSHLGMPARDVPLDRRCVTCGRWHGRPVVPGSPLELSVSHAGLLVVAAVGLDAPVGIDVERVDGRPLEEVRRWTLAEARFKAGGERRLVVHELTAPVAGHVLTLVTAPRAAVQVLPFEPELTGPGQALRRAR